MMSPPSKTAGNMLLYILGAILLLGILIVLVKGSFQEGTGIDGEKISMQVSEVQRYASELERGVNYILHEGNSETDIRFAIPDTNTAPYGDITVTPTHQVFDPSGGGVEYKLPPTGVNDGTKWQFYATTHIENLGTNEATPGTSDGNTKAELLAVLPKVTRDFCERVNLTVHQTINLDNTTLAGPYCVYDSGNEFTGTYTTGSVLLSPTQVTNNPAKELCVKCSNGTFNYYHVLLTR